MTAAEWAAHVARMPSQAQARFVRASGLHPSERLRPSNQAPSVVQPGMLHRFYPTLPAEAKHAHVNAVAGMVGGAGYTHSTAPGSQHLYTPKMGPGWQ